MNAGSRIDDIEPGSDTVDLDSSSTKTTKLVFSMKTRDAFFARVTERLRRSVAEEHAAFTARPMFNLIKIAYDNERIHYEVAFDNTRRTLEVALHFEDGPASTLAYLDFFGKRIVEIKDALGHEVEIERWTLSWGRIYEVWPLETLDRAVADRVAARLAEYIAYLEPLVAAANVARERSAASAPRREFRRRSAKAS